MADITAARTAKRRLCAQLARRGVVCGVGLARRADGWVVQLVVRSDADRRGLPVAVDGVPVRVRTAGAIRPLPRSTAAPGRTRR